MHKHCKLFLRAGAAACAMALCGAGLPANSQQNSNDEVLTAENIDFHPVAYLEFLDAPLLSLEFPPPGSTFASNGVQFLVVGNATATLSAQPDDFFQVAGPKNWLGKAVSGSQAIGYDIQLQFLEIGQGIQIETLPGSIADHTSPLAVDLAASGGQRAGSIHLLANREWTEDGGLPLPGLYQGSIVLTLTVGNF